MAYHSCPWVCSHLDASGKIGGALKFFPSLPVVLPQIFVVSEVWDQRAQGYFSKRTPRGPRSRAGTSASLPGLV